MDKLFVCTSPFHVLITVAKSLINNEKCDIVLCRSIDNCNELINRLKASELFKTVEIFNSKNKSEYNAITKICKDIHYYGARCIVKQLEKRYDFTLFKNHEIYLFDDDNIPGYYLQLLKIHYNLIESSIDCYKKLHSVYSRPNSFIDRIKRFFGIGLYPHGYSKYVKTIEVNNKHIISDLNNKMIEMPKKKLYKSLNESQVQRLIKVFLPSPELYTSVNYESTLIVTQPLYQDGFVKSKEEHLAIYRDYIDNYSTGLVIIKPHPRDNIDYEAVFKDCIVWKENYIPLEIFNFIPTFKIRRAITAFSTSLNSMNYCDEKLYFGLESLKDYSKGLILK